MTGTTNPYMALLEEEEQRRQVTLGAALLTGLDVSPDAHAAQRRDAVTLGVPTAAVAADPRGSAMEAQAIRIKADTAKHPALQQRYTDDDFRRLAHDDSGALARLGDWVANSTRYVMGADRGRGLPQDLAAGFLFDGARGAAGAGRMASETLAPLLDVLEPATAIGGNPLRRLAEGFEMRGAAAKSRADELSPPVEGLVRGGVQSGVRSLGSNLAALPWALLPGGGAALHVVADDRAGLDYSAARQAQ
jgi:hypothetical protein